MGAKRLGALHVHDVSKTEDSHTIPYQGVVDWQKFMQALKTIGYLGICPLNAMVSSKSSPRNYTRKRCACWLRRVDIA